MVQAILEGRKTMTRRTKGLEVINASGFEWRYDGLSEEGDYAMEMMEEGNPKEIYKEIIPAYNVSDVLWVRETHRALVDCATGNFARWDFKADMQDDFHKQYPHKWKPSIFMPKEACRIFLKVKAIRVERLHDISEEDAKNEGVQLMVNHLLKLQFVLGNKNSALSFLGNNKKTWSSFEIWKAHWAELWCTINGRSSWDSNPFVWVYEFERIEKPLDFK